MLHVVNVMFGRSLGGIEQSFVDYCSAIHMNGCEVTALIHPKAAISAELGKTNESIKIQKIGNLGLWDIFAILKIRKFLKKSRPDVIITHGTRAATLLKKAAKGIAPVIGVAHNYSISRLIGVDAIFTITQDLKNTVIEVGQNSKTVFMIPNMINLDGINYKNERSIPPVIGSMGRMVKKKGFDIFINALSLLRDEGAEFKAILGGEGPEEKNLREQANKLGLEEKLTFLGWIKDREEFYNSIDIFCLPSLHEPFGIVLIEAFSHKIPTVTTDSEGPSEIATDGEDALIIPKNNAEAMKSAIKKLLDNQEKANKIAENSMNTVKQNYEISAVGKKIVSAVEKVVGNLG